MDGWEKIAFEILDQKREKKSNDSEYISRNTTPNQYTRSRPSSASSTYNTKQNKLSPVDKENIKLIYSKLDPTKLWKLFSGVLVEKKEEFALKFNFEQYCASTLNSPDG
jgi:hypothetical protein